MTKQITNCIFQCLYYLFSSMSSRFVSAGTSEEADKVKQVVKELSESEKAVKMKLYGNMTREVVQWHPARLLCIRFNVKPPFADESVVGVASGTTSKFDLFGRLNVIEEKPKAIKHNEQKKEEINIKPPEILLENDKPIDDKMEKPSIDLFKSIFLASTDSEERYVKPCTTAFLKFSR